MHWCGSSSGETLGVVGSRSGGSGVGHLWVGGLGVAVTTTLLVDISSTVLGVLLESWTPFDRPVAKTLAALFFTLMEIIFNRIKIIEHSCIYTWMILHFQKKK